ncbi:BlaI/MecI/CopY family transcriptional regulator [Taibaiella soli]|uniref:BlaI/MecI/CopY family transcriptional regulator n=1 Tax=Taibaiella soli TaxID=1649169 RepID=A0A2W2BC90_9BACT|nr:BlaI/MecI/CopY family transcriptional regulator [Taibaiella soli]PZF73839.1 BlaI/MecI/CopY family transcriptional regulator [Taibaiella soli]
MKQKKQLQTLTKAEEEVMQIIWELDKCLVRDILEKLGDPEMPHSTISSVVRILEKKGFVDHKAYGKTYEYFPIINKEDYAQHGVQSLMEKYFGGSPKQLVSFLVKKDNLNLKELNELMKKLDDSSSKK